MSDYVADVSKPSLREELQSLKDDADLNLPPKVYEEVLATLRYRASLGFNFCTVYSLYPDYIMNKLKYNGLSVRLEDAPNTITIYWGLEKEESFTND